MAEQMSAAREAWCPTCDARWPYINIYLRTQDGREVPCPNPWHSRAEQSPTPSVEQIAEILRQHQKHPKRYSEIADSTVYADGFRKRLYRTPGFRIRLRLLLPCTTENGDD